MRKIILVAVAVLWMADLSHAQTLDEVLARNYQSRGGLDKLKASRAVKMSGKIVVPAQGLEMPVVLWQKSPEQACGWRPPSRTRRSSRPATAGRPGGSCPSCPRTPRRCRRSRPGCFAEQAEFENPLVVFREKGYKLELLGGEDMDGKPVFKLKLTKADGREIYFYLDAGERHRAEKLAGAEDRRNGEPLDEILYGDYRPVDGMMMPFAVENRLNGQTADAA